MAGKAKEQKGKEKSKECAAKKETKPAAKAKGKGGAK